MPWTNPPGPNIKYGAVVIPNAAIKATSFAPKARNVKSTPTQKEALKVIPKHKPRKSFSCKSLRIFGPKPTRLAAIVGIKSGEAPIERGKPGSKRTPPIAALPLIEANRHLS